MTSASAENLSPKSDLKWSAAEKTIARRAFDRALQRELEALIGEVKQMAGKIEQPTQLWQLEDYLTKRRKQIDRQYDYRYSVLPAVLGHLIRQRQLTVEELRGLGEDKLSRLRRSGKFRFQCFRANSNSLSPNR